MPNDESPQQLGGLFSVCLAGFLEKGPLGTSCRTLQELLLVFAILSAMLCGTDTALPLSHFVTASSNFSL